jgi:DNA-binding response OmpR family regulator
MKRAVNFAQNWVGRGAISPFTGWGQEQDKQRAVESGFDAHLTKPADPQQLADTIRSLRQSGLDDPTLDKVF